MNDSVKANFAAGLPGSIIDDERVWEALDRAQRGGLLRERRDGMGTVIGEHGARLSGGQRQRIGFA